jgi:hypothetical protein
MRNTTTLWSVLLIILTMAACRKAETPAPANSVNLQMKKAAAGPGTATTAYGGQATGINATIWNTTSPIYTSTQTLFSQTALLAATGGVETASAALVSMPGVLTAESLSASTTGQGGTTTSTAAATNLSMTVSGHTITATQLQADAAVSCGAVFLGSAQITNLVIDGTAITVTGAANQAIPLAGGGTIIINQQSTSKKGGVAVIEVTALRVIFNFAEDIKVATARAEIKC